MEHFIKLHNVTNYILNLQFIIFDTNEIIKYVITK